MHAFSKLLSSPNGHGIMRRALASFAEHLRAGPTSSATQLMGSTQPKFAAVLQHGLLYPYRNVAESCLGLPSSHLAALCTGRSVSFSTSVNTAATEPAPAAPSQPAAPTISPLQAAIPAAVPRVSPAQRKDAIKEATCHYRNVQGSIKKFNIVLKVV
jgi:hypothetical protein